jgi:hypothetical protein
VSAGAGGGAGCWTGGGVTGWTTGGVAGGVIGTAAAGGVGAGAATGAGVGVGGGIGVGAGGAEGPDGGVTGGVCGGGVGFGGFFGAGATGVWVCPMRTTGVRTTRALFAFVFRTTFGAWWLAGNSAAGTTTICGAALSEPGAENGSMYGDVVGVRASDQRRAETPAHAATTTTAASRRTPT